MSGIKRSGQRTQTIRQVVSNDPVSGIKRSAERYQTIRSGADDRAGSGQISLDLGSGDGYEAGIPVNLSPDSDSNYGEFLFSVTDVTDNSPIGEEQGGSFDTGSFDPPRVVEGRNYPSTCHPVVIRRSPADPDSRYWPRDYKGTSLVIYDDGSWILNCWTHGCQRMTSAPRRGAPAHSDPPTSHQHRDGSIVRFIDADQTLFADLEEAK